MSNNDYYTELATYWFANYEFHKELDLQAEQIKKSGIEFLEAMINMLKERLPKEKQGKIVKMNNPQN